MKFYFRTRNGNLFTYEIPNSNVNWFKILHVEFWCLKHETEPPYTKFSFHIWNWNNSHMCYYYMAVAARGPNTKILQFDWFANGQIFRVFASLVGGFKWKSITNNQKKKSSHAEWSWWRNSTWNDDRIASIYLTFSTLAFVSIFQ